MHLNHYVNVSMSNIYFFSHLKQSLYFIHSPGFPDHECARWLFGSLNLHSTFPLSEERSKLKTCTSPPSLLTEFWKWTRLYLLGTLMRFRMFHLEWVKRIEYSQWLDYLVSSFVGTVLCGWWMMMTTGEHFPDSGFQLQCLT